MNGRQADVSFVKFSIFPGTWHGNFSFDTEHGMVSDDYEWNDCTDAVNQQQYLNRISTKAEVKEIIHTDWSKVGNEEDVILAVLKFLRYNDVNRLQDEESVANLEKDLRVSMDALASRLTLEDFGNLTPGEEPAIDTGEDYMFTTLHVRNIARLQAKAIMCLKRIAVYDAMRKGKPVGAGWNNESFLRDFPDSAYAAEMLKTVNKKRVKRVYPPAISCF
jgi:hypothetical protein